MCKLRFLLLLLVCTIGASLPVFAETWDLASSFSTANGNPNGQWSYGWLDATGIFTLYNDTSTEVVGANTQNTWRYNGDYDTWGNIAKNTGSGPIAAWGSYRESSSSYAGPGSDGRLATARWTAPQNMIIDLAAKFSGISDNQPAGTTTDVHVFQNGVELFGGLIYGFVGSAANGYSDAFGDQPVQQFDKTIEVSAGDAIDFCVGAGSNGVGFDTTGIAASITMEVPNAGTLSGKVMAKVPGSPAVSGAVVKTSDGLYSAKTAYDGSYSLQVPQGSLSIVVTADGYEQGQASVSITAGQTTTQDFALTPTAHVWDAAAEFTTDQNPNGVWSYGWITASNSDLTLYNSVKSYADIITEWCQNNEYDAAGNISKNPTDTGVDSSGMWWNPQGLCMHPGPSGQMATVRWTSAVTSVIKIDANFAGANYSAGATTDVHILKNGVSLFDGHVNGFGGGGSHPATGTDPECSGSALTYVAPGDAIDISVGSGDNGYSCDLTGMAAKITSVPGASIISGKVTANASGHPLIVGATVKTSDGSMSAVTGLDGKYELVVSSGTYTLEANYPHMITSTATVVATDGAYVTQDFDLDPGNGTTYYVSTSGNDDNDGKSLDKAWKSITNGDAKGLLKPGDTVVVAAGTYPQADYQGVCLTKCSGTADYAITYKADGKVIIDQSGVAGSSESPSCGFTVDVDGVAINGFEITGCQWGIVFSDNHSNNSAIGNLIHGIRGGSTNQSGWQGWCGGICNLSASNSLIRGNVIYDIGDEQAVGKAVCVASSDAKNVRIENNTLVGGDYGSDTLNMPGSGLTVVNNIITGMKIAGINSVSSGVVDVVHNNNLFYNNAADYGIGISEGPGEINADPAFVDAVGHNYHLQTGSPAIDAGVDVGTSYFGSAPDLGAYEYAPEVSLDKIGDAKKQPDGVKVTITQPKAVTVGSSTFIDGDYYVEEPDRASGIKITPEPGVSAAALGDRITFAGTLDTDDSGERVIRVSSILSKTSGDVIRPLGMTGKAISGVGLQPSGLLVRIWGWVTDIANDGKSFYINDGSSKQGPGVKVVMDGTIIPFKQGPGADNFVGITGIAGPVDSSTGAIKYIRVRSDSDMSSVYATVDEMSKARRWFDKNLGESASSRPFSFVYNGVPSSELLSKWKQEFSTTELDENRTQLTITYTDPNTDLQVKCVAVDYNDYPTVEWTVYFKNTGSVDTPILENIEGLDTNLYRSGTDEFLLHHNTGSPASATDYQPWETVLSPNMTKHLGASGGKSTKGDWSYFNVEYSGGGTIIVVGWPGQWAADLTRDASNGLHVIAGQELTHMKLHPGEEVRSPLIVMQFWNGEWIRSQNVWRRWMLAHSTPKDDGETIHPFITAASSDQFSEMTQATAADQMLFIDRYLEEGLKLDYWWMDAGWYPCGGNWPQVGTWEVDYTRFPNGLREVSDHAAAKGVKTIVWFEPERVSANSWITNNHPEWVLGGAGGGLLNLGNPDAWNWLVNHIDQLITDQGIGLYRQDFNMDPLGYWRGNDAEDRQGITENKHVVGYLAYWDALLERHPGMLIDSCASGGMRNDLETMRRSIPLWRTDYPFEPNSAQCHSYGINLWIPLSGAGVRAVDDYSFRSNGVAEFGMHDDMRVAGADFSAHRRVLGQWRQYSKYFLGDYYPLTPYSSSTNSWLAWQFDRPEIGEGAIQAFRRPTCTESTITLKLHGLVADAQYTVTDIDTGIPQILTGSQLMDSGLQITATSKPQAFVIMYKKVQ